MNKSLAEIHRVDAPPWAVTTLMVPVFLGLILCEGLQMAGALISIWVGLLVQMLIAPFAVLWLFADICCISFWFLTLVVRKMTGGRK